MGRISKRALKKKEDKKQYLENEAVRARELENDKLRKQLYRESQDIVVTNQRKLLNLKCTNKRMQDPVVKKANLIASRKNMLKRLQNPEIKKANLIASTRNRLKRMENPVSKKIYQIQNVQNMRKRRLPSDSSICQNVSTKKKTPNSISYKQLERQKLNETRQKVDVLISEYILKRSQGLSEKCYSCHRLRFPSSVNKCNSDIFYSGTLVIINHEPLR